MESFTARTARKNSSYTGLSHTVFGCVVGLPHLTKRVVRNILARHEPIHYILITRVAELYVDVVYRPRKPRIPNERQHERVSPRERITSTLEGFGF